MEYLSLSFEMDALNKNWHFIDKKNKVQVHHYQMFLDSVSWYSSKDLLIIEIFETNSNSWT